HAIRRRRLGRRLPLDRPADPAGDRRASHARRLRSRPRAPRERARMSGLTLSPAEQDTFRIVMAVRQLMEGRSNATGAFTLATSPATSTLVAAPTCGTGSIILLM